MKKKPPKEPDYTKMPVLPNKQAVFVQTQRGLTTDLLQKLLESADHVDPDIEVARRQRVEGKKYSKLVGGRKAFTSVADALKFMQERAEDRRIKEEKINELFDDADDVDFDDYMHHYAVRDSLYPQPLAPIDIVESVESAGEKLDALDRDRAAAPTRRYLPREETMLDVITLIKKQAPLRLARRLADWQKAYIATHSPEQLEADYKEWLRVLRGDPTEEERLAMEEAARIAAEEAEAEEERLAAEEAARSFGDLPDLHTLLDDVADLIKNNPEAATAIIRLWIGNAVLMEKS